MKESSDNKEKDGQFHVDNGNFYNYRGIAKYQLNDMAGALTDFKRSAELGCEKGKINYKKLLDKLGTNSSI
jgi:hypothetical protein